MYKSLLEQNKNHYFSKNNRFRLETRIEKQIILIDMKIEQSDSSPCAKYVMNNPDDPKQQS